jgi:hypothetical protein
MAEYTIEHKKSFTLTAYGFSIQSNFQDMTALQQEKAEFGVDSRLTGGLLSSKTLQKMIVNGQ